MRPLLAGIDIGTTSTKVVVITIDGNPVYQVSCGYPLHTPHPGYAELDPDEVFEAVLSAFEETTAQLGPDENIVAVGFSSAMHSVMLLDNADRPLTRLITWADARSESIASTLRSSTAGAAIYRATGTPIHPMTPLCKLAWMNRHEPDLLRRANAVMSVKEFVFHRLFGERVVDHSLASATGLFDIFERQWFAPALECAGITEKLLSTPVTASYRLPKLIHSSTERIGLSTDTPFFAGASDGCLANLGVGAMQPGEAALTIGTSGAVRVASRQPAVDPEGRLFTYILDEKNYITGGAINSGGILIQWFKDQFAGGQDDRMEALLAEAAATPAGSEGLLCLPYLLGERAPHWNSFDRGVFFGVTFQHTPAHFLRSLLEGSALTLRQIVEAIESLYGDIHVIYANGGFARSAFWVQMLADVLNKPVLISPVAEASAIGAALLAGRESGHLTATPLTRDMQTQTRYEPDEENRRIYDANADLFSDLYRTLHPLFVRQSQR